MALPLDYIGKFVIVLVAVAVGAGIIMSTQSGIDIPMPEGDKGPDSEIVDVGSNDAEAVGDLIDLCYQHSRDKRHENFVCFMARSETGSFSLSQGAIDSNVDTDNVDYRSSSYNRETIIIRYSAGSENVVVED